MSWWDDLSGTVGEGLSSIGSLFGGSGSATTTPTTTPDVKASPGLFSDGNLLGSVLNTGLGLAGTYFKQSQDKSLAEQYAAQKKAELEAQMKLAAMQQGGGGGGPDRAAQLSQLYSNWAAMKQRAGESEGQMAQEAGKMMQDPIIARLGRL